MVGPLKTQEVTVDPRIAREGTGKNTRNGHKNSEFRTVYVL